LHQRFRCEFHTFVRNTFSCQLPSPGQECTSCVRFAGLACYIDYISRREVTIFFAAFFTTAIRPTICPRPAEDPGRKSPASRGLEDSAGDLSSPLTT
jgi:hypothetical protein